MEQLRSHLLEMIQAFRLERQRTVIAEFDRGRFDPSVSITRIGGGSLGGKARGVAFANRLLRGSGLEDVFPDLDAFVPPSVVLGTQVFDEFMEHEGLRDFALSAVSDAEITQRFIAAPFPRGAISDLRAFLQRVRYPLAVRSSSLLEDSLSQPFAGVYRTYMLPNNQLDLEPRWRQLATAIKRVYASVFLEQAKAYLSMTSYRIEEEKMAVMVQAVVGRKHKDRFYPDFSGVARSHNFYPDPGHCAEDGVVAVALGMGHAVVGGEPCLRFCPKRPKQLGRLLVGEGRPRELATRVLRARPGAQAARGRGQSDPPLLAGARRGGRLPQVAGLDVSRGRQPRRGRHRPGRHPARQLRAGS